MNLHEKLLEIQKSIDRVLKDGVNTNDKFSYVSSENILETIRPLMNQHSLLLHMRVKDAKMTQGETKSGTARFFTEIWVEYEWVDCESDERLVIPFYSQGTDLGGERGVGKALTYNEKYYLLKQFHIPTANDDPDGDGRTGSGEKKMRGTQAAHETAEYIRNALPLLLDELYAGDAGKIAEAYVSLTKNDARGYAGVVSADEIPEAVLPVVYGKAKVSYRKRLGKEFKLTVDN